MGLIRLILLGVMGWLNCVVKYWSFSKCSVKSSCYELKANPTEKLCMEIVLGTLTFGCCDCFCLKNTYSWALEDLKPGKWSINFMAAVPVCSDFGAQENKVYHCSCFFFPNLFAMKWRDWMPWLLVFYSALQIIKFWCTTSYSPIITFFPLSLSCPYSFPFPTGN